MYTFGSLFTISVYLLLWAVGPRFDPLLWIVATGGIGCTLVRHVVYRHVENAMGN